MRDEGNEIAFELAEFSLFRQGILQFRLRPLAFGQVNDHGLKAYTRSQFFWVTIWWYIKNTGIPVAFGATGLIGFVVGLAIFSQTFYSFVLENLRNLGALTAKRASYRILARMIMLQILTVGLLGYGRCVGLASVFGSICLKKGMPPFFLPWQLPLITLGAVLFICWLAASLGIRKIRSLEPAIVFRG